MIGLMCVSIHLALFFSRTSSHLHFFSCCVCISGFGQDFAPSCGGGVYGMCSGTACGSPLGGVAAAHGMFVV